MRPTAEHRGDGYAPVIVHIDGSLENIQEIAVISDQRDLFASRGWTKPRADGTFAHREDAYRFAAVVVVAREEAELTQRAVIDRQTETFGALLESVQENGIAWSNGVWMYRAEDGSIRASRRYPLTASMERD